MLSNLNEYYESNLNKSNSHNRSYFLNSKINEFKIGKEYPSNKNKNNIKKAKSFSINKNCLNDLALKYNILNYDISYRAETFRATISDITDNKVKNIYNNMKFTIIDKNNKKEENGTEKEDQLLIENNYLDKYNMLKSYLQ